MNALNELPPSLGFGAGIFQHGAWRDNEALHERRPLARKSLSARKLRRSIGLEVLGRRVQSRCGEDDEIKLKLH